MDPVDTPPADRNARVERGDRATVLPFVRRGGVVHAQDRFAQARVAANAARARLRDAMLDGGAA